MKSIQKVDTDRKVSLPTHIGIIMDGNGRWAKKRGLPRSIGHKEGASNFKRITMYASKIGLQYLTMYAFSTENWRRPETEVGALMRLFKQYLEEALRDFLDENIKVNFLGDVTKFPIDLQGLIQEVTEVSKNRTGMVLNLAMNYGGRAEILRAVNMLTEKMRCGERTDYHITEQDITDHLYTAAQPDPDLIIRPSGEQRISNFLLWQSAYSEFAYFDILWPDFKEKDLDEAIELFAARQRRFGAI